MTFTVGHKRMWSKFVFFLLYVRTCVSNNQPALIEVPSEGYLENEWLALYSQNQSQKFGFDEPNAPAEVTLDFFGCRLAVNRFCPDPEVAFYLYSKKHPEVPELIRIGSDPYVSNLTKTAFNPKYPSKIIIHGYNSDMNLSALTEIRKQYLMNGEFNIFAVDWAYWVPSPCYPAAVWNTRHAGKCTAQLVERMKELGAQQIHVIGFSLGAHVTNYMANEMLPYKVPRITGLDPALPGFITSSKKHKLDKSDAHFVDVIHTNAFIQGKVEECGHVDFFMNGGVIQPGCWAEDRFFACNHHRAPLYFAESINSRLGFWGWPCPSYLEYLIGRCPPRDPQIKMGEHIDNTASGMYLVITDSVSPFAVGKYTGPAVEIFVKSNKYRETILKKYKNVIIQMIDEDELMNDYYTNLNGVQVYRRITEEMFDDSLI